MERASNQIGPIAQTYDELQAIPLLLAARGSWPTRKCSRASALRAILQAAEIALLNLTELSQRAASNVMDGRMERAATQLQWCVGFHRLLAKLSLAAIRLTIERPAGETRTAFENSPALHEYLNATRRFDSAILQSWAEELRLIAGDESLESPRLRVLQAARICAHEAIGWERRFSRLAGMDTDLEYGIWVDSQRLRQAVESFTLAGDTFLTQFRGLHQIPELMAFEANDHLGSAIGALRSGDVPLASVKLASANELLTIIAVSATVLVDSLTMTDYHRIRENLGVTSGSHSIALRYHLSRDLYGELAETVIAATDGGNTEDPLALMLLHEALRVRSILIEWRETHIHLARNNLGSNQTRSLVGSQDAVSVVMHMRDDWNARDALSPLARRFGLEAQPGPGRTPLAEYFQSSDSLDSRLLAEAGSISKVRFPDVQCRTGIYSHPPAFTPPPHRSSQDS